MKKIISSVLVLSVCTLVVFACKKKDNTTSSSSSSSTTTTGGGGGAVTIASTPQVSYTMNGTAYTYVSNNSTIESGSGSSKSIGTTSTAVYSAFITDGNMITYMSIDKGTLSFIGGQPDATTFKNFFTTGAVSYSANGVNGVELNTVDSNGDVWSSGTGPQSGSTFTIDAVQEETILGTQYMKFKASFSCKLYDATGANAKTITNGVYVGYFENQ